jgi:hypothetical protein
VGEKNSLPRKSEPVPLQEVAESNGEKNSLSRGRGKGEGLFLKSVSWLKSEKLILVLPTDSLEDPESGVLSPES